MVWGKTSGLPSKRWRIFVARFSICNCLVAINSVARPAVATSVSTPPVWLASLLWSTVPERLRPTARYPETLAVPLRLPSSSASSSSHIRFNYPPRLFSDSRRLGSPRRSAVSMDPGGTYDVATLMHLSRDESHHVHAFCSPALARSLSHTGTRARNTPRRVYRERQRREPCLTAQGRIHWHARLFKLRKMNIPVRLHRLSCLTVIVIRVTNEEDSFHLQWNFHFYFIFF